MPEAADELAVRISPSGKVYTSLNNRGWKKRLQVDTDFEYHVIFDMENISVLTLMGVATGLGEADETPKVFPDVHPPSAQNLIINECVVCLSLRTLLPHLTLRELRNFCDRIG